MTRFALITEGITDQVVIDNILGGHYDEDVDVQIIQPARDATDQARQGEEGGFERVLEFCQLPSFSDIFLYNEFLIIHIDTDIASHPNININPFDKGRKKSAKQIVEDFSKLIQSKIAPDLFNQFGRKIVMAIPVDSIECWILPIYEKSDKTRKKDTGCENALQRALNKSNTTYSKDYNCYQTISKPLLKRKVLEECASNQASLKIFLDSLPPIENTQPE
ncbi:hypothetical protein HNP48_001670 [Acidovorax soli]|uniref:RloB-like protein n=1 Tax=Acidovorax soli TaxID=592050 RepID=A0A7X0U8C8_9BURK|nr:phage tail protein [Acidovorax soli]MBB6559006.1 hypothetical protein [Acidovorax soli]